MKASQSNKVKIKKMKTQAEVIKRIDKVSKEDRKSIISLLEKVIKAKGVNVTRLVILHYFSKYGQTLKRKQRIAELKKEISELNKKG